MALMSRILIPCVVLMSIAALGGCARTTIPPQGQLILRDGKWVREAPPIEGTPAGELAIVRKRLDDGKFAKSVKAAKLFMRRYPGHELGEEVMVLAGTAEMTRGRYMSAYDWFEKQLANYPAGRYFDRALYREFTIADEFLRGKKQRVMWIFSLSAKSEALEMLMRIAEHAPGAILAEDALLRIADHHFSERDFVQAVEAYDNYFDMFTKTSRASYALYRSGLSLYLTYRGVVYDPTPLVEAEARFKRYVAEFPSSGRQEEVAKILADIAIRRAHKDYYTARLYDRIGRDRAAIFYYKETIDRGATSVWANKARSALRRFEGEVASVATNPPGALK